MAECDRGGDRGRGQQTEEHIETCRPWPTEQEQEASPAAGPIGLLVRELVEQQQVEGHEEGR